MASKFADSYYARLGVSKDATAEEIRSAYHEAAKHFHPDTHPEPGVTRLFLEIQEAYEVLSDPQKRAAYDLTLPPLDLAPDVELSTLYSRPYLIRSSSPQLLYILQEIKASPEQRSVASPSLNLCLVIDRSTSMKGARLERVKATARQLLHQLRPDDVLSVIAFSDRAEVILPATRGVNLSRVEARINLIQAGGGTELYHGLLAGLQEVSRYLNPSFVNHLILITDGHTYGDEQACLELAEEAKDRGIAFTGLGIGSEWNDDFIDRLAGKTGGSSIFVSSSKDVRHYLEGQFRGLSQTYAEAVRLKLELPPQVQLRYAFRLSPIPGKLELDASDHPIVLGNIQHKKPLSVLYELFIDHCDREVEAFVVGEGTLIMDIPTRLLPTVRLHVRWEFPIRQTVKNPAPPAKIVEALSRLNLYRMQEQAYKELEEGNYEQATLRLRNLSTHLLAQGEHALAASVLEQVTRIEKGEKDHRGGEVQKRIKYGTRALLLPPGTEQ